MAFFVSGQISFPVPVLSFCRYSKYSQPSAWRSAILLFLFVPDGILHNPFSFAPSADGTPHTKICGTGALSGSTSQRLSWPPYDVLFPVGVPQRIFCCNQTCDTPHRSLLYRSNYPYASARSELQQFAFLRP